MSKVKMTPSEAMVEVLLQEGVKHVTGIVGSAFMDMLDLFPDAGIEFIPVRHERPRTWRTPSPVLPAWQACARLRMARD